ncbi:MerR family transcriptional regulator [Streptomyces sp. NPDC051130]|uniref:MerR family transcriptional regulator n=1 Tax=Streptomyces sp. NPDC051130 TaxID=3157223 RepID=UPI00342F542A
MTMLIGQLAQRTGTSERLLRYYERVGLLAPVRQANGYRDYDDAAEQRVGQIRSLLAAGLPTSLIRQVLPCALADGSLRPCPGVLDKLRAQLARLDERADELAQARHTLTRAIATAQRAG